MFVQVSNLTSRIEVVALLVCFSLCSSLFGEMISYALCSVVYIRFCGTFFSYCISFCSRNLVNSYDITCLPTG